MEAKPLCRAPEAVLAACVSTRLGSPTHWVAQPHAHAGPARAGVGCSPWNTPEPPGHPAPPRPPRRGLRRLSLPEGHPRIAGGSPALPSAEQKAPRRSPQAGTGSREGEALPDSSLVAGEPWALGRVQQTSWQRRTRAKKARAARAKGPRRGPQHLGVARAVRGIRGRPVPGTREEMRTNSRTEF